jgi:hypothetical protein
MGKRKAQPGQQTEDNSAVPAERSPQEANGGETTAGYFRRIFKAQPGLLGERSNDKLLQQWLTDHPGHAEVPKNVKSHLSNLKSVLRSKKRKKLARRADETRQEGQVKPTSQPEARVARKPSGGSKLDELELQIDECLILAKHLDREGLGDVIALLRRARNEVVWKIGQ